VQRKRAWREQNFGIQKKKRPTTTHASNCDIAWGTWDFKTDEMPSPPPLLTRFFCTTSYLQFRCWARWLQTMRSMWTKWYIHKLTAMMKRLQCWYCEFLKRTGIIDKKYLCHFNIIRPTRLSDSFPRDGGKKKLMLYKCSSLKLALLRTH
jgi:hypothetical protein